jgi:hypothetical protein
MAYVSLVDPVGTILAEIADPRMKRNDVAATYAFLVGEPIDPEDIKRVNHAIVDRWSLAALKYVKERAWKLVEGRT